MATAQDIVGGLSDPLASASEGDAALLAGRPDEAPLAISDNLPDHAAISNAELDAIETFLSDILDQVLGNGATPATASLCYKKMT
jgi:hypothetical protein